MEGKEQLSLSKKRMVYLMKRSVLYVCQLAHFLYKKIIQDFNFEENIFYDTAKEF